MKFFSSFLKKILLLLMNLFLPNFCINCFSLINEESTICINCKTKLEEKININQLPYNKLFYVTNLKYIFKYSFPVFRAMYVYGKYNNSKNVLLDLSKIIKPYFMEAYNPHYIYIPIPISRKRKYQRGFNQCEIILKSLIPKTNILNNVLIKIKDNPSQTSISLSERIINPKDCYKVINDKLIIGKDIILFDDVFTTGSTINECSKVLINAGVKSVQAFVLSIAIGDLDEMYFHE